MQKHQLLNFFGNYLHGNRVIENFRENAIKLMLCQMLTKLLQ